MKSMCELCDLNPGKIITFDNHGICKHCAEHLELKPKEIKDRTMESIIKRQEEIIKRIKQCKQREIYVIFAKRKLASTLRVIFIA